MNIPDEAERRYPDDEDRTILAVRRIKREGFEAGAVWARREALREAAEAAAIAIPYGVEARSDAVHAILALREEGQEGSK